MTELLNEYDCLYKNLGPLKKPTQPLFQNLTHHLTVTMFHQLATRGEFIVFLVIPQPNKYGIKLTMMFDATSIYMMHILARVQILAGYH